MIEVEAVAFLPKDVLGGNAAVVEGQFRRVGGAPAMLVEGAGNGEAGGAFLDEEHGDRLAGGALRIGLGGDAVEVGVDAVGDEHLGAVEDEIVAVAAGGGADALHVGAGVGLGDADGGDGVARDDAGHVGGLLGVGARVEEVDGGHVGMDQHGDGEAGVGGAAEFLGQHGGGAGVHRRAAVFLGVADAEEAERAHLAEHVAGDRAVNLPLVGVGLHLLGHEAAQLVAQHFVFLCQEQVLCHASSLDRRGVGAGSGYLSACRGPMQCPCQADLRMSGMGWGRIVLSSARVT